jgi:competence protein ComEA
MPKQNRSKRALVGALLASCALLLTLQPALAAESAKLLDGVVNVNTANTEELQLLPGVGESRAKAILEIRKSRGGFKAVSELTKVKGIGDAMVEILRPYVTLSGKTTARRL